MKNLRTETVKEELSQIKIYLAIELATKQFTDACYDLGFSAEKTKKLMISKEGLDAIAEKVAKLI
tara:strand:- start:629 stop:823 length:195 start_codon:yes stop_codon:yes gene_type:complete